MVENNIFYEIGDSLDIDTEPMFGVTSIIDFEDVIEGENVDIFFIKSFQYTIDGLNWSEWKDLININLETIIPKENHIFKIRYRYTRSGTDSTGELKLLSINLNCNHSEQPTPINFEKTIFAKFNEFRNLDAINWTNNVLKKTYIKGIVANYIERSDNDNWGDEDYIDLFYSIVYLIALTVVLGRKLEEVIFEKDLLQEFLKQKGLFLKKDRSLIELTYLCTNYYNEIRKRGTNSIIKKDNTKLRSDGELLRLINWNDTQEFIFGLMDSDQNSWNISNSSPSYRGLTDITNVIKGYEDTKGFNDLSKYPLLNPLKVNLSSDTIYSNLESIVLIDGVGVSESAGLGGIDISKAILIDPSLDYEITFFIKKQTIDDSLDFGVLGFDLYDNPVNLLNISDFNDETNYFFEQGDVNQPDMYYFIRGIIYNKNQSEIIGQDSNLNIGFGNNLKFKAKTKKIIPQLLVKNNTDTQINQIKIWDFKVRPLRTDFSRCFTNSNNNLIIFAKNLSERTKMEVEDIMTNFLLPYNITLLNTWINE